MSGVRKSPPESCVPGETLTGEGGGINSARDMEAHPCLMRFLTNLARLCAQKCKPFPERIHSDRIPLYDNFQPGTEDSARPFTTPDISVPDASSNLS